MKAVRLHDKLDLRCEDVAKAPDPAPDEVRVQVAYAGICGSDIHNFKTGQWISRKPSIAGHEFSGFVEAVGANVRGLEVGDKVAADSRYYCSDCANCRSGKVHLCESLGFVGEAIDGGFAGFITVPAKLCLKCKPDAALDIAALAEPLAVALHALNLLNIPNDEPLLIIGCGPIGALSALASTCRSNRALFICDVNAIRAERCAELSGAAIVDLASFSQSDSSAEKPVRYVLDTTGNIGVIDMLLQKMSGCTIGLVGIGSGELTIDPVHLVEREISIVGCHAFADELPEAIALLHERADQFEGIIGERITLEQTVAAYGVISSGKSPVIKTLIEVSVSEPQSRTARIRELAKSDEAAALVELRLFLIETFDIEVHDLQINHDQYSLNSLNGFFRGSKDRFFFKFHQEEGEEEMSGEYYRADLIAKANLPIDLPVLTSVQPGEQILVYRRRDDRRFSDVLRELDDEHDEKGAAIADLAERKLNEKILTVAKKSLHPVTIEQVANEPIHRLFYERLIDIKTQAAPGGRFKKFYIDQTFAFPGATLSWAELANAKLVLNGQAMISTIGNIFDNALENLHPAHLANAGGVVAHGDAHNANVWFETGDGEAKLSYFDPAFAGEHFPSLLVEAKATFHNIFAHPFWLYDPQVAADRFKARVSYEKGVLAIDTDWALTPVRERLLRAKAEAFWQPFLMHLKSRDLLPENWEATLRSALAMSPALVMNLRANVERHNPTSSAIGFYVTALVGSRPVSGNNVVTEFLTAIDPDKQI